MTAKMMVMRCGLAMAVLFGSTAAMAAPVAADGDMAVLEVVAAFGRARLAFDPAAVAATITDDYVEISPVGAVDPRAAMLGFYAPANRRPAPPMTTGEQSVRRHGKSAIVLTKVTFRMNGTDGAVQDRSMRVGYLLRQEGGRWLIASSQVTPIR